jgi:hypothetical protein
LRLGLDNVTAFALDMSKVDKIMKDGREALKDG